MHCFTSTCHLQRQSFPAFAAKNYGVCCQKTDIIYMFHIHMY